jgi:hypothetical protein
MKLILKTVRSVDVDELEQCCRLPSGIQDQGHRRQLQKFLSNSLYETIGYNEHKHGANARTLRVSTAKVSLFSQSVIRLPEIVGY